MSIQEPAWLKRTRPCPFFSQGRCLFADACNFLHDVKVRSAVTQPLHSTVQVKQLSYHPGKPVLTPPSVVVNSASPRSVNLASPQSPEGPLQDSSRYSGLLSVLSDVIGPPSDLPVAVPAAGSAVPTIPCSAQSTEHDRIHLPSESNSFDSTNTVTGMDTEQDDSTLAEPSSILKDTSVDPFGYKMTSFFPRADGESFPELHTIPEDEESGDGDTTSYVVEATETYVIGSDAEGDDDDEAMDDRGENSTMMLSNRQSTLSSFTGASLLASPRRSVFGEPSVAGSMGENAEDLLSPVEMSAKLRPFSVLSSGSKVKRGDSIDSGYADGDSWVSPVPFSRSPPRSFRSPVTSAPHSRRASLSSPTLKRMRVSYDVLRPSPHDPIEAIKEVDSGTLEVNEEATCTILGVYSASPSKGQLRDPVRVLVDEENAEEDDKPSEVPAVRQSLRRYSPEHLYPTREHDLDPCHQPSFISDDNLSFKTALSTQPSYDDLSDISRVSPVKQDSLLSPISSCSTPNTSVLSHYGDVNESLEQSVVDSHMCESSYLDSGSGLPEATAPEECLLPEEVAKDSNSLFAPASDSDLRELAPERVVASRGSLSAPSRSVDTPHDPAKVVLGHVPSGTSDLQEFIPEKVASPQNLSSCVFPSEEQHPKSSSPAGQSLIPLLNDAFNPPSTVKDHQASPSENIVVSRGHSSSILRHERRSPKSSPLTAFSSFSCKDVHGHNPTGADGAQRPVPRKRLSVVLHLDERFSILRSSAESPCGPSSLKNRYPPLHADGHDSIVPESFSTLSQDCPAEYVVPESRSPKENSFGSGGATEALCLECESFPQRLSFPLPPPFLPAEIVGPSTLGCEGSPPVLSKSASTGLAVNGYAILRDDEMEWIHPSLELTERARPSQLPSAGPPDSTANLTLRRSRAASDLTVKAKSSPVNTPGGVPDGLCSPLPPSEQPDGSDSVQSLYDQYFDNDGSESPSSVHDDMASPDDEPTQEDNLQSLDHTFQKVASTSSGSDPGNSGSDSARSEIALRPLLTGRRSFLRSSLAELIPKARLANDKETSVHTQRPVRLQTREIGSTIVPLGFRRQKHQSAQSSRPSHSMLPASQLREVLQIRTDIARMDSPPGCSSATHVSFATRSPLPAKAMSAPPTGGLRQLHLSSINKRSSILSTQSSSIASSILSLDQLFNSSAPQSPSVSSTTSFSHNSSLSPSCVQIPEHMHHTPKRFSSNSVISHTNNDVYFASRSLNRCESRSFPAPVEQPTPWRLSRCQAGSRNCTSADGTRRISRTSTLSLPYSVDEEQEIDEDHSPVSRPIQSRPVDDRSRPASALAAPVHAIATPKPNLLFAIASDNVEQVRQVLESGEAGPNDCVGPQSALAFTLTNDKLVHKQEIVKALLAYGANPSALRNPTLNPAPRIEDGDRFSSPPPETTLEGMDPATRYFVARADASHTRQTSQLIYRSFFRPLTRVRYDVIGQDWALEQLFRVLSIHSQKLAVAPIVVLLCGPSGHGKSLLARKFGSLLGVPTHTVNMTTLRSAHDIWQSYSMSPYEEPSSSTLAEFLTENEGERCIVVLDEIEKVEDQKALWSLFMPWELGRCSLEAGKRHVDARNVIWLGTSNIGHELVFEHHEKRAQPDERMTREDYLELTAMLRPRVSHCLGASLVSRVTTVLPFVPFTMDEKKAIAAEAVYALAGDTSRAFSPQDVESLVTKSLPSYHPSEGARSLHRAISNILVDAI